MIQPKPRYILIAALVLFVVALSIDLGRRHVHVVGVENIFAGIDRAVNTIDSLKIAKGEIVFDAKKQEDGSWVFVNKNNFPANQATIQQVMILLANAKVVEAKTSNPDLYGAIQLDDPATPGSAEKPWLVALKSPDRNWSYLVGKLVYQPSSVGYFVRASGDQQSWLVTMDQELPTQAKYWIDRGLLKTDYTAIDKIAVHHPKSEISVTADPDPKNESGFKIVSGKPWASDVSGGTIVAGIVTILSGEFINDIVPYDPSEKFSAVADVVTKDGLILSLFLNDQKTGWRVMVSTTASASHQAFEQAKHLQSLFDSIQLKMDEGSLDFLGIDRPH